MPGRVNDWHRFTFIYHGPASPEEAYETLKDLFCGFSGSSDDLHVTQKLYHTQRVHHYVITVAVEHASQAVGGHLLAYICTNINKNRWNFVYTNRLIEPYLAVPY